MSTHPYSGDEKIVFALDCGTTMSAVAFAHLLHGVVPQIRMVNEWPYQEEAASNCKFPTVVRYDSDGKAPSFGAEALEAQDDETPTFLTRWFKLLLHPREMRDEHAISVPPLPRNVTLKRVYTDFIAYTFAHAVEYFVSKALDGAALWTRLKDNFELVFAVPNGWSANQHNFIREAVVDAGIFPESFASERLAFVSEAEASVHFAVEHMNVAHLMRVGDVFTVVDAGGSTVDSTMYRCQALAPYLQVTEVTSSECIQAGSVFVDNAFANEVRVKLAGSKFSANEHVRETMNVFETRTKRRFTGAEKDVNVHFGRTADTDKTHGVIMGRLTIETDIIRRTFQPSVNAITSSICRLLRRASQPCETFVLVGGFSQSPYLRSELQERLEYRKLQFVFGDEPSTKAAAEGACSWKVNEFVSARAARCTYGICVNTHYNMFSVEHRERENQSFINLEGRLMIPNRFDALVLKHDVVKHDEPILHQYSLLYATEDPGQLEEHCTKLLVSDMEDPGYWAKDVGGELASGIRYACNITADLSGLKGSLKRHVNPSGQPYWQLKFSIELFFGRTTLCAAIVWEEGGETKRGDVAIIANSVV